MSRNHLFVFDRYRLDEQERQLLRDGQTVALPPKLFDLLAELVKSAGHLVQKQDLLETVWADTAVEEGTLTRAISSLRQVFGANVTGRNYIETVPKRGYRFVVDVVETGRADDETRRPAKIPVPPMLAATATVDFVGRDAELQLMHESWLRARGGLHQLLLVTGEPGIGKTRLSTVFARRCVEEGTSALVGHSDEENLVPYQSFVQSLGWYVRHCPESELREQVRGIDGVVELGQFLPELRTRMPDLAMPASIDPEGRRYRLFEAIGALISAASRAGPILFVFDDLHWADKPTLLLLRHLMRSARPGAFAIVATYRETELGRTHPLADMLVTLRRELRVARLQLRGLGIADLRALVDSIIGRDAPPQLAQALMDGTDGNPFFATEILRHLKETGAITSLSGAAARTVDVASLGLSEGIKEVIGRRLSRLSESCNRVLAVAAVVGRVFDAAPIEAVGDLPESDVLDALEEAVRAQLIAESGENGRFEFTHALVRETLYSELSSARRLRLHRRVGDAVEQLTRNLPNPPLAELAYHFFHATPADGVVDKAIAYASRAGDRAAEGLAHEEAGRLFDIALQSIELLPMSRETDRLRVDLHRRRARSYDALGQWTAEVRELEAALRHLEPGQIEARCEMLLAMARASFLLLDVCPVEQYATEALRLAELLQRSDLAANAIAWQARCRQASGDLAKAIEMDGAAISRAPGVMTAAHMLGPLSLYLAGRSSEAIPRAIEAADAARSSGDITFTMYALAHLGLNMCGVGRYTEACNAFREVRTFGRKYGAVPMLARATAMAAGVHLTLFDFDGAEALQSEARELGTQAAFAPSVVSAGIDSLLTLARRHEPGRAERLLEETAAAAARTTDWHQWLWQLRLTQARAELAFARRAFAVAFTEADDAVKQSRLRGRPKYQVLGLVTRARAGHALGRTRDAIADATTAVELADGTADPALLLLALDALIGVKGTDELAARAVGVTEAILQALPDEEMRRRFVDSEVVRRIRRSP